MEMMMTYCEWLRELANSFTASGRWRDETLVVLEQGR